MYNVVGYLFQGLVNDKAEKPVKPSTKGRMNRNGKTRLSMNFKSKGRAFSLNIESYHKESVHRPRKRG